MEQDKPCPRTIVESMNLETAPDPAALRRIPPPTLWRRLVRLSVAFFLILLAAVFGALERIAHRPSPVRMTVDSAEIQAEDARLKQLGLVLHDGSLLKERPFEPPWTPHSLLIPSSWTEPGIKSLLGSRHVRADLLLADLHTLQPVMERAYGGWDSAADRGWNWPQWFAAWRNHLAAKGTAELPYDEAFAPIDALLAFQRDNHTQIPLNRSTSDGSQTAVLATSPTAPCTELRAGTRSLPIAASDAGQQVRTARLWRIGDAAFSATHYIAMPMSYGTPQTLRCGDAWIPLQRIGGHTSRLPPLLRDLWREMISHPQAQVERLGNGVVYARLPTFVAQNYEQAPRNPWPQRQPGDRVLIVDLRDNEGNDASYGLDVLEGWIDESRMAAFDKIGSQVNASCLYTALRWSYPEAGPSSITQQQRESLQRALDRIAQPYPPGCPREVASTPPQWTYLQHRFAPGPGDLRILAVVNSHCGSDCELLTAMLASLPETLVAGVNTYGLCQQIQPGYSILPHTGLRYRIALGRSDYYGDNRSVDGYGLDVDVVLPEVDTLEPEQLLHLATIVAKQ
jgi:hypothetical protein